MHRHKFTLWCWTLLLAFSYESWGNFMTTSNDKRNNSTVQYEIYSDVTTTDRGDNEELVRLKIRENFPKNNDYDDIQYEFYAHSMKNHESGNQMSTELRAKSTKANDRNSSMNIHELRRNVRQAEDRSNLTLYEFQRILYEDDITFPYEMCKTSTCVRLCCPLGSRLAPIENGGNCSTEKANYPFPDLYYYEPVTSDSWKRIPLGRKLDEIFPLSVHDPCNFTRYLLEPDFYPKYEYEILNDGTLYLPRVDLLIDSYCFAVVDETDKYEVIACFSYEDEVVSEGELSWGITVPYKMCENSTCVQLCCPLGSRLIATEYHDDRIYKAKCSAEKANYSFPELYDYEQVTNDSWERISLGKKLDQVFLLSVHDPCNFARYVLKPGIYPEHEYTILNDGTVYLPRLDGLIDSYCFAVVDETDKYTVTGCVTFEIEERERSIRKYIIIWHVTIYSLIVSLPFFLVTFLVYSILSELRNTHGCILRAYVASSFVAYMFLGILHLWSSEPLSNSACITAAFIIHFSMLASFFWLNVMCFDIWWTFGRLRSLQENRNKRERKKFVMYSIYAWGSTSLFAILWAIMDFVPSVPKEFFRPGFGVTGCGFSTIEATVLYFHGPVSVTVICNICLFISTVLKLVRYKKDVAHHLRGSESRRNDDNKQRFHLYLKLLFVMGVNFSLVISYGLFAYPEDGILLYVRCLIDLISTLQGLFVFIIFVWKERIKRLLLKRFKLSGS